MNEETKESCTPKLLARAEKNSQLDDSNCSKVKCIPKESDGTSGSRLAGSDPTQNPEGKINARVWAEAVHQPLMQRESRSNVNKVNVRRPQSHAKRTSSAVMTDYAGRVSWSADVTMAS